MDKFRVHKQLLDGQLKLLATEILEVNALDWARASSQAGVELAATQGLPSYTFTKTVLVEQLVDNKWVEIKSQPTKKQKTKK